MLKYLAVLMFTASPAWAGCVNFTENPEDAPKVTICFKGECVETVMQFECANANLVHVKYMNGWGVIYDERGTRVYRPVDVPANEYSEITCTDAGDDACRFPN